MEQEIVFYTNPMSRGDVVVTEAAAICAYLADVYVGSHIGWGMEFGTLPKRPEFEAYWNGLKDRPAHRHSEELIKNATAKEAWADA